MSCVSQTTNLGVRSSNLFGRAINFLNFRDGSSKRVTCKGVALLTGWIASIAFRRG
jgi:hypothetical protein